MLNQLLPGFRMTLLMTLLTGLAYPSLVTGLCQVLFPRAANGSLVIKDGKVVGSEWIGQQFTRPEYFQGRPSAAGADGYDASASGGSNLGPTSRKLIERTKASVEKLRQENPTAAGAVSADLATASGSGLDPHLSPAAVSFQIERVARARGISSAQVQVVANQFVEGRDLGFLGESRVNVLKLNLALDERFPVKR